MDSKTLLDLVDQAVADLDLGRVATECWAKGARPDMTDDEARLAFLALAGVVDSRWRLELARAYAMWRSARKS